MFDYWVLGCFLRVYIRFVINIFLSMYDNNVFIQIRCYFYKTVCINNKNPTF